MELYAENISFNESFTSIAGLMGQKIKKMQRGVLLGQKALFGLTMLELLR